MASRYVPAAGRAAFTRLYDPVLAVTMREGAWRDRVASLAGRGFIVDVGCGTGAQSLSLAASAGRRVVGVDGDPAVLSLARRKAGASSVEWRVGLASDLPVETGAADAVVMTLLLHHLDADGKRAGLAEAVRVLRPGGRLCVADWGRPRGGVPALGARVLRAIDGEAGLGDQLAGKLPSIVEAAGFGAPSLHARVPTVWGTLELLAAERR